MTSPRPRLRRALLTALPLTLALGACGSGGDGAADEAAGSGSGQGTDGASLQVIASFYPLEYLTSRVAGEHAEVTTLTSPGVDPHDVELTPRVVGSLGTADLVVYSAGMQSAVNEAVATQAQDRSFDVTAAAELLELGEEGDDAADDHDHADDDHADHDHGPRDPHFWLDPVRYGHVAEAIAEQLATVDPDHAEDYRTNAVAVVADLTTLDEEITAGLASCESRDLVTTHEAFGYLAHRYDLNQLGITGISPDTEPSPARLAEVSAQVRELGVSTIYAEPILSSAIAETVARETGADVLVLDPVEGITDASAADDYLGVMRANLDALQEGLRCS